MQLFSILSVSINYYVQCRCDCNNDLYDVQCKNCTDLCSVILLSYCNLYHVNLCELEEDGRSSLLNYAISPATMALIKLAIVYRPTALSCTII